MTMSFQKYLDSIDFIRMDRINNAKMRIMNQPFTGIYAYKWTDREIRKIKSRNVGRLEFNRIK